MDPTDNARYETFRAEANKLLAPLEQDRDVFEELWQREEYRLAYRYLHDSVITPGRVQPGESFAQADEAFYWHIMENY